MILNGRLRARICAYFRMARSEQGAQKPSKRIMNERSPPLYRHSNTSNWEMTKLPSARGTHKSDDSILELDKRHLTFLVVTSIRCRRNRYRCADNLCGATRSD